MTITKRPRVAAISLDGPRIESIKPLCGELRPAHSSTDYLKDYSWTETDVLVSSYLPGDTIDSNVNLLSVGPAIFQWKDPSVSVMGPRTSVVRTDGANKERELAVPPSCPDLYKPLAVELSRQLGRATKPPNVIVGVPIQGRTILIETTSGQPVALRFVFPARSMAADSEPSKTIALLLPSESNLVGWFRSYLCDLHVSDPTRVPQAPPRLSQPSNWYTPEERGLAERISRIEFEFERLSNEREKLHAKLAREGERADTGIRRVLWSDGDNLTAAVTDILIDLGFVVRNMDSKLSQNEPKREDLRLTLECKPGWEATVEVKGYTSGIRTNDARQIREHRERYMREEGRSPDLTLWLSNSYRTMDPSSRPAPDQNLKDAAELVGAVHVLAADLYRQWVLIGEGSLDAETVVQRLVNADPGLWTPPAPGCIT